MKLSVACNPRMLETALLLAAVIGAKFAGLIFDPTVRLFFGDSASYLHSALTGWIPPDRSFLYGLFVRGTAISAHSMYALAIAQSLLGAMTACLLFRILRDSFEVPRWLAATLALCLALEPAQLFYERMVMAESAGTTALALMFFAGFAWLRRPHWAWPLLWAFAGILAVALRVSSLPVVLGFAALPVLIAIVSSGPRRMTRRLWLHFAIALVATVALHYSYKHLYGHLTGQHPDYIVNSGAFRLGLIAPLVTREEVVQAGLPADLLDQVGPSLRDPRARESQIWQSDGLIAKVDEAAQHNQRVSRKLAAYAVRGNPFGLIRLALATLTDYFDAQIANARLADDLGQRPADDDVLTKLRTCCDYDARGLESRRNLVARYFAASRLWLTACYFCLVPLALAMLIIQWHRARAVAALLAATAAGIFLSTALFSHIVSFRYLHPFPFVILLCAGAFLAPLLVKPSSATQRVGPS